MNSSLTSCRRVLLPLALLVVAPLASVAASTDAPNVNVSLPSEGEALAKGFERAFEQFKTAPLFLTYEKEGTALRTIAGIRDVRAEGAVLVIVTTNGTTLAIPAKRVIALTDERPSSS